MSAHAAACRHAAAWYIIYWIRTGIIGRVFLPTTWQTVLTTEPNQRTRRKQNQNTYNTIRYLTSCAGGRHNIPRPLQVDLWTLDLESGVRGTCDVRYLYAKFSLPRPLCSWLRPDVRDRQTSDIETDWQSDVRHAPSLNASALWGRAGGGIIKDDIVQ